MQVSMMMAMDRNKLIGRDNDLPWKISSDLQYFKRITMGKPLVMGRATFDSLGRVLPGRPHVVITRNRNWQHEGVDVVHSLDAAFAAAREYDGEELMIIGGASICEEAMPSVGRLYLTVIDHEFEGDRWLNSFNRDNWVLVSSEQHDETQQGGYRFSYEVLEAKNSSSGDDR